MYFYFAQLQEVTNALLRKGHVLIYLIYPTSKLLMIWQRKESDIKLVCLQ